MKPRVTTEDIHGFTHYHLGATRLTPGNTTEIVVTWPNGLVEKLPVVWKQVVGVSTITGNKIGKNIPHVEVAHHGVDVHLDLKHLDVHEVER